MYETEILYFTSRVILNYEYISCRYYTCALDCDSYYNCMSMK